jgi:very-short-patch-repair endonuclease
LSRAALRTLIDRQEWSQSRRGIYAVVHPGDDLRQRAALRASAAARARPGSVVSCESAAVLHGLPVTRLPLIAVLTACAGTNGDRALVHVRRAALRPAELGSWFGVPVTGVSRTIADLARTDTGDGLMAADAAMRERLVSRMQLRAAADECAGWPGCTKARWVAEHVDARSESPLESLVRGRVLEAGLPSPELQVRITDPSDGWSCRVDFLWRAQWVVLEADGQVKYRTDGRALWNEKRRQERLEQLGYRVVRVTWSDIVDRRAETVQRVRRSLGCP